MLSGGGNAFTWNARNQVATLNSVSLQYDAFGRRTKNAGGTSFLYNGANAVQELSGSTVTANLLGGGIDEVFSRADSSGSFTPLKDALGSAIALVDSSGNVQTAYSYDPFGNTSVTGTSNANEFQYTGRENEGNGLYYYRARYYSPVLQRFISQDPLGFAGSGPNLYSYASDTPSNLADAFGLSGGGTGVAEPPVVQVVQKVASAAEAGTATAAVATTATATAEGTGTVITLLAEGSAGGSSAGPAGVVVGVGVVATGGIIYNVQQSTSAAMKANAADDEVIQAIHNLNQVLLQRKAQSLAGRYTGPRRRKNSRTKTAKRCMG